MSNKTPDQDPSVENAIPGGVTNELPPDKGDSEGVRRRDDLTIRGADPKELDQPRQISDRADRKVK